MLAGLDEAEQLRVELAELIANDAERVVEIVAKCNPHWSTYYAFPPHKLFYAVFHMLGAADRLRGYMGNADQLNQFKEWFKEGGELDRQLDGLSEDVRFQILPMMIAVEAHLRCLGMFSVSLDKLLEGVLAGNDNSLFEAVLVSKDVLATAAARSRIFVASITNDRRFFQELAKSLTDTRPRRPAPRLDVLRICIEVMRMAGELDLMTMEERAALLIDDLRVYPRDGQDPVEGLKKAIQNANRRYGK